MKRLSWKRIVAALGIVAMLASNLSDVATVYAAAATDGTASTESVQPQAEEQSVPSDGGTGDINVPSSGEGGDAITEQPSGGDDDAMAEQPSDGDGETKTEQPAGEVKEESSNSKQDADAQVQNKETAEDTSEEESTADIKQEKADDTDTSKNVDAIKDTTKAAAQENANEAGKHSVSLSFSFDSDDNTSLSTDVDQSGLDEDGDSVDVSSMVASGITVDQNTYQYTGASLKNDNDDSTITDSLSQLKKSVSDGNTTYQYMNTDGSDWSAVPDDADEITIVFHYQKEAPKEKAAPVIKGKISFTAIFDDEDSKAIPDHAAYSVPDFDTLSLTEQPIAIDGYTYKGAKVNGNAATEIIKTTATDDDGNKTCTYTYDNGDSSKASTIDGTTAEITFVYTPAEKKNVESIVPTVKCVDEDGKTIKNSTDTLPTFENSLALGDTDKAPVTLKGYTYKNAKIGSTVISSLTKEEKEDKDTGAKTTVYSYTADGASDATVIDEATEITLVFTKDAEEKAISISLSWVDENGDKIEGYAKKDLPSFDDKLTLDDTDKAPLTIKGYTYTEARIGKTVISSLTKEEKEDKDTGDKTTVYSYTADDKTVEITDDTTITLAYKADAKEAKLTLACVDEDGNTIDGYAKKDLPSFDDKLVLNDTDKAPVEIKDYFYKDAKIDGTKITSLSKEVKEDKDTGDKTTVYSYTADGKTVEITDDTTITLEYEAADKIVKVDASCVDEFGDSIADKYTNIELPEFASDGTLALDDVKNPPVENVQVRKNLFKVIKYTYVQATIDNKIIKGLKKTEAKLAEDSKDTSSDDSKSYVYSYTTDGETWTKIKADTTVKFEYSDGKKTTFTYEDDNVVVTATLQHAGAIPDDAELKVTPVTSTTDGYNYDAYMQALNDNADKIAAESGNDIETESAATNDASTEKYTADNTLLYDIAFMADKTDDDGNVIEGEKQEYEPTDGMVKVSMVFKKKQLTEDIQATDAGDITVVHMPLTDAAKENVDTTADATNIDASDVKIETLAEQAIALKDGNHDQVDFAAKDFSIYVFSSGNKQGNYWSGTRTFTSGEIIDALGWATDYAVVSNKIYNNAHIEGNVATGDFEPSQGGSEGLNNASRIYKNNSLSSITVTKTVQNGSDGTFKFAAYQGSTIVGKAFTITTSNKTGSITLTPVSDSAIFTALSNAPVYIYELDGDGKIVDDGGTNGTYTVSYNTVDDENTTTEHSNVINSTTLNNLIGKLTISEGMTFGQTYFGPAGTITVFGSGSIDGWSGNNLQLTTADGVITTVTDFKNISSSPTEYFKINTGIASKISKKLSDLTGYSATLAEAINGATGTSSPTAGGLNVINVISTTGNLQNDLSAAYFNDVQNGGFITGMLSKAASESEADSASEYLLINIDCTGRDTYSLSQLHIDGFNPDSDDAFSRLSSHVIYNFVTKNVDGTYSAYDGNITNTDVVGGLVFAPAATVIQGGGLFGEVIANTLDRKSANGEIHKKTISNNSHSVTLNVANTAPHDTGSLEVTKTVTGTGADKTKDFSFTVTLSDTSVNGTYGNVIFTNGVATFTLKNGENKIAKGLPTGVKYTVVEASTSGYSATKTGDTGSIVKDTTATAAFTNTFGTTIETATAQFGGKKTLTGKTLAAGMFTFNLKGTSANDSDYTDTATNAADGSYTFKEITYKATGTYTYEVSEANGGTTVDGIKYDDKKYTVTVKVTDDGKGKLVATPSENAASLNFSNSYTTNDVTAQFGGKKTLTGKTLAAGMFTFNLKGTSANDSDYTDTATNAADGSYTFKEITYKATGTYTYEVSEANGGTTVDGIKYDDKKYTVTVKVTDDGKGKLVATPSENAASLNFSNSYTTNDVTAQFGGKKTLTGKTLAAGMFTFNLKGTSANDSDYTDTATNAADGSYTFKEITYKATGTYTYEVSEANGGTTVDGIKYDDKKYTVTVKVTDDGKGKLVATPSENAASLNFSNSYTTNDVTAQFGGKKTLTGKTLAAGMFTFNLKGTSANDSDYTDTATNAADGSYTFKEITYKATGTYTYEVSEANGGTTVDGIKYDDKKYTVTVKVTDDGKGKLVATPSENAASLNFSNSYTTNDVTAQFGGKKTLTGKTLAAGMFTFNLKGTSANDSDYTDTATNAADGSYTFKEITYKATGTYTYEVSEANGGTTVDGIKYDDKKYTVTVKVTDDGKGKLVATPSENAASLNFSNSYTTNDVTAQFGGKKTLTGKTLAAGMFTFNLKGTSANDSDYTDTATNAADGSYTFKEITYKATGTYTYEVSEANGGTTVDGIKYDDKKYTVTVKVTDDGKGKLVATPSENAASLNFSNSYTTNDVTAQFGGKKTLTGKTLAAGMFTFNLKGTSANDSDYTDTATNAADGSYTFKEITYKATGTYTYEVSEANGGTTVDGIKYDDKKYTVTVKVTDDGKGKLVATPSENAASLNFSNSYTTNDVTAQFGGKKTLTGKTLAAGMFTFNLKGTSANDSDYTDTATNAADGSYTFKEITYKATGTYTYEVSEANGGTTVDGIKYDDKKYTVTVKVTDDGKGKLVATPSENAASLNFSNSYTTNDVTAQFGGKKTLTGKTLAAGMFTFNLKGTSANDSDYTDTATNAADGSYTFKEITYKATGTYTYEVSEANGGTTVDGIKYDDKKYTVTVKVTDDGKGKLVATPSENAASLNFSNSYTTNDVTAQFGGKKTLTGKTLAAGMFTFNLKGTSANDSDYTDTATNAADGSYTFKEITYKATGTYTYEVSEANGGTTVDGIKYDDKKYTVTVKVTDDGKGKLVATPSENAASLNFSNSYTTNDVTAQFGGKKTLTGKTLAAGMFTFNLKGTSANDSDYTDTATNAADGSYTFKEITYKATGTYTYEVSEANGGTTVDGIKYDDKKYTVTVKVTDDGKGKLVATPSENAASLNFSNSYTTNDVTAQFGGKKTLTGKTLAAGMFTFNLKGTSANDSDYTDTATNAADGSYTFKEITYKATGTYTYEVSEANGGTTVDGIKYDDKKYTVTVKVTDDGKGKLVATPSENAASLNFSNSYTTNDVTAQFGGKKTLTGKTLAAGMFTFNLKGTSANDSDYTDTATNAADGSYTFKEITYKATGTYTYEVSEANGGTTVDGIKYDDKKYTVTVKVTDDGKGKLVATPSENAASLNFSNSYTTNDVTAQFGGKKTLTGKTLAAGMFTFNLKGTSANDSDYTDTATNAADGSYTFKEITYKATGTYTYEVSEANGGTTVDGIKYDDKKYTVTVKVTDDGKGKLVATPSENAASLNFSNSYTTNDVTAQFGGKKTLTGKTLAAGMFTFNLKGTSANDSDYTDTATNAADGSYTFKEITYKATGTYTYEVSEANGGTTVDGIKYDDKKYTVTVKVTDDGKGKLVATPSENAASLNFSNSYTTNDVTAQFGGKKTLTGKTLAAGMFTFNLKGTSANDSDYTDTATNAADGSYTFKEITYKATGTYTYEVSEANGGTTVDGIKYDDKKYTVTVKVTDDGKGKLVATPSENAASLNFSNSYTTNDVTAQFGGKKTLTGKTLAAGMFTFNLKGTSANDSDYTDTATNAADGSYTFKEITYKATGTYTYEVSEANGGTTVDGIKYDDKKYTVTVKVTDDGKGKLVATPSENAASLNFSNSYTTNDVTAQFGGKKTLTGKTLAAGMFTFNLKGTSANDSDYTDTATNAADGSYTFKEITYKATGTYTYEVSEANGGTTVDGIKYDDKKYTVTVKVTDDGKGKLVATPSENAASLNFSNSYTTNDVTAQFGGKKTLTGKTLAAGMFTFNLKGTSANDSDYTDTATNAADGSYTFKEITYKATGTYTYEVSEANGGTTVDGIKYDDKKYTVTVKVTDDGKGKLVATPSENAASLNFSNSYTTNDVTAQFGGKKTLTGKTLAAGMFTFNLKGTSANDSDYTDTATNAADGSYTFKEITYKATGTYTYEVSEANGGTTVDGIKYDDKKYTVTVKVTDDGKGKLVATPSENAASLNFSNSYTTNDVTAQFGGKKTLTGKTLAAGMFTFNLKGTSANDSDYTDTATNAADGSYTFKEITYKATGTYTYEVSEANGGTTVDGIKYDDKKYTVTVKVTDDGKGKLVATPSENAASLNFSNSYTTNDVTAQFGGKKTLTGKTLAAGMFTFNLKGTSANDSDYTDTATNAADGSYTFKEITYKATGTYTYEVSEANGGTTVDGIKYDDKKYTVTVKVTDDGKGKLVATPSENAASLNFSNSYTTNDVTAQFGGKKTLTGKTLAAGMFTFNLKGTSANDSDYTDTATNAADGSYTFKEITYKATGTYTYEVSEANGGTTVDGIKYDDKKYTVTVKVTDDGKGKLVATPSENAASLNFSNSYTTNDVTAQFGGKKTLTGKTLAAGMFTFNLKGTSANDSDYTDTATNAADGSYTFKEITYKATGTYTYEVSEANGGTTVDGIKYDDKKYTVTVKVTDDGKGKLVATPSENAASLNFSNSYTAAGQASLKVQKLLSTGTTPSAGAYAFQLIYNGNVLQTKTNDGSGLVTFDPISYSLSDIAGDTDSSTFTYTIHESSVAAANWTNASDITITVTISDDSDGTMKVLYNGNDTLNIPTMTNTYTPDTPTTPDTPSTPETPTTPTTPTTLTTPGEVLGAARQAVQNTVGQVLGAARNIVQTGDSSQIALYGTIMAAAAAGLIGWIVAAKKKKKKEEEQQNEGK